MNDEQITEMIGDLEEQLEMTPSEFTDWERNFIEDLAERDLVEHLTIRQQEKLADLWERKC